MAAADNLNGKDFSYDPEIPFAETLPRDQNQQNTPDQNASAKRSMSEKIWDYLESRFNSENWFGSLVTPTIFYTYLETFRAAKVRQVNGVLTPDKKRAISAQIFMAEKAWSFFSDRGGKFPDGENVVERAISAIRHPQASSTQFEWLFLLPARCYSIYAAAAAGLKAYGVGLKAGEKPYKEERIRLYLAGVQAASAFFTGVGHFRKREVENRENLSKELQKEKPVAAGDGEHNIARVVRQIWKYDRVLLIGSVISTLLPALEGVEGWVKSGKSRKEATHLIKAGTISTLIGTAYTAYTFQRIERSNYRRQAEDKQQDSGGMDTATFAQKLLEQQPVLAKALA